MKTIVIVLNIAVLSLVLSGKGLAQDKEGEMVVTFSNPDVPGFLYVDNFGGNINIEGYEGKTVVIKSAGNKDIYPEIVVPVTPYPSVSEGDDEEISKEGLKKIKSSSFEINVTEEENRISIKAGSPMNVQNLDIKIPYKCSLKLNTVNGNISVKKVTGEIEINTVNGKVILDEISGSAVTSSINGIVKVKFREVKPDAPMAFSTINNHIDVTLPASTKATLKMKTDGGDIYTDFNIELEEKQEKTQKESKYTYTASTTWVQWTTGKINGGGAEYVFKSLHGDIHIRKGK